MSPVLIQVLFVIVAFGFVGVVCVFDGVLRDMVRMDCHLRDLDARRAMSCCKFCGCSVVTREKVDLNACCLDCDALHNAAS